MHKYMVIYYNGYFSNPVTYFSDNIQAVRDFVFECADTTNYCQVYELKEWTKQGDVESHYEFVESA